MWFWGSAQAKSLGLPTLSHVDYLSPIAPFAGKYDRDFWKASSQTLGLSVPYAPRPQQLTTNPLSHQSAPGLFASYGTPLLAFVTGKTTSIHINDAALFREVRPVFTCPPALGQLLMKSAAHTTSHRSP